MSTMDTERYCTDNGLGTIDLVACFYIVYQTRPFSTDDLYLLLVDSIGKGLSDEKFKGSSFILELQCMLHFTTLLIGPISHYISSSI